MRTNFYQTLAFSAVISSIDSMRLLPEQVFAEHWERFLFFESDKMFAASFVDVLIDLIQIEKSNSVCLLNYDQTDALNFGQSASFFIDGTTDGSKYISHLRHGGPSLGWLFRVDRYGCASDSAQWCIYCEKANDVAVIALRSKDVTKFARPLKKLRAETIRTLVRGEANEIFPFTHLTNIWKTRLTANYAENT